MSLLVLRLKPSRRSVLVWGRRRTRLRAGLLVLVLMWLGVRGAQPGASQTTPQLANEGKSSAARSTPAAPAATDQAAAPTTAAAAAEPTTAAAAVALGRAVDLQLASPAASRAHWGISVVDAATGASLFSRNDAQLFEPASNAKLFTTAAALALLGSGYTIETRVVAEGEVGADGTLHGNLRLVGAGDPTLSGRRYPFAGKTERPDPPLHALDELAAQVAASGIRAVAGKVIGDDTLFAWERYGAGWGWDDLQWDYGAPVSALTAGDNVRYLTISPAGSPGELATASWDRTMAAQNEGTGATGGAARGASLPGDAEALNVTATLSAPGTPAHLGIAREVDGGPLRIYGSLPAQSTPVHAAIAVEDPAAFAARGLVEALAAHGVAVAGGAEPEHRLVMNTASFAVESRAPLVLRLATDPGQARSAAALSGRVVASRSSPPLRQMVTVVNKVSQNLHAEILLRLLGSAQADDGSVAEGARVVRQFLIAAHIDPQDFTFVDGCGLSPQDLVTPRSVTTLLVYAARQPWGADYRASLPVGGVDGTLAGRFLEAPLKGRVAAKTGTLAEVNALSGYLTAASGRTVAFSILCNDYVGEGSRAVVDRLVAAIAQAY